MSENKGWSWVSKFSGWLFGWINLEQWIESTAKRFWSKPRRILWAFLTCSLFCVWGGFDDYWQRRVELGQVLGGMRIGGEGYGIRDLFHIGYILFWSIGFLKFLTSAALAFFICAADTAFTSKRIKEALYFTNDDNLNTLLLVLSQCGIIRAYRTETQLQTSKQHYASDIRAATAISKNIRMMSIAGYEYLGSGSDSLLYSIIEAHPEMNAEFIFLDPDKANGVITERVNRLRQRDPTITTEILKRHINETFELLRNLKGNRRGNFALFRCRCATVFRLIFLDGCVFVSAYKSNAHGHESRTPDIESTSTV